VDGVGLCDHRSFMDYLWLYERASESVERRKGERTTMMVACWVGLGVIGFVILSIVAAWFGTYTPPPETITQGPRVPKGDRLRGFIPTIPWTR
jgi:hypothetical protein